MFCIHVVDEQPHTTSTCVAFYLDSRFTHTPTVHTFSAALHIVNRLQLMQFHSIFSETFTCASDDMNSVGVLSLVGKTCCHHIESYHMIWLTYIFLMNMSLIVASMALLNTWNQRILINHWIWHRMWWQTLQIHSEAVNMSNRNFHFIASCHGLE